MDSLTRADGREFLDHTSYSYLDMVADLPEVTTGVHNQNHYNELIGEVERTGVSGDQEYGRDL